MVELVSHPQPGIKTAIRNVPIEVSKTYVKTNIPLYLHEFAVECDAHAQDSDETLVIMHGYGAGLGFFYKNFDGLSAGLKNWNIYALDWLGYGLSARPKFHTKTADLSKTANGPSSSSSCHSGSSTPSTPLSDSNPVLAVKETEDWFVESLEAWRKAKKIERFTLLGHSMGGYLAAVYAFRYPQHVTKLIMVSPAGVERGHTTDLDDRSFFSLFKSSKHQAKADQAVDQGPPAEQEVTGTKEEHLSADRAAAAEIKAEFKQENRQHNRLLTYLWNNHISPFSLVRFSGIFGPKAMSAWSNWRFSQFPMEEQHTMHMYSYKTFSAAPSGEHGMTRILAPGTLARMPLIDRVNSQLKCPSFWIYGDRDWMNADAGVELVENLNKTGNKNQRAKFHIVEDAGHHVYLDNHEGFNSVILEFMSHA